MENANPEITNLSTLTRFLLSTEQVPRENRIELANLFTGITLACKITSNAIKRAGFDELFGVSGQVNVHAEEVKKLGTVQDIFKMFTYFLHIILHSYSHL